jgi:hypothetical protein
LQWHTQYQVYPLQGHHSPLGEHLAEDNPLEEHLAEDNPLGEHLAEDNPLEEHLAEDNPLEEHLAAEDNLEDPQEEDNLEADRLLHRPLPQQHQQHPLHHKPQMVDSVERNPRSLTEIATKRTSSSTPSNCTGWLMH